jgi:hypothetical protein
LCLKLQVGEQDLWVATTRPAAQFTNDRGDGFRRHPDPRPLYTFKGGHRTPIGITTWN